MCGRRAALYIVKIWWNSSRDKPKLSTWRGERLSFGCVGVKRSLPSNLNPDGEEVISLIYFCVWGVPDTSLFLIKELTKRRMIKTNEPSDKNHRTSNELLTFELLILFLLEAYNLIPTICHHPTTTEHAGYTRCFNLNHNENKFTFSINTHQHTNMQTCSKRGTHYLKRNEYFLVLV